MFFGQDVFPPTKLIILIICANLFEIIVYLWFLKELFIFGFSVLFQTCYLHYLILLMKRGIFFFFFLFYVIGVMICSRKLKYFILV